MVTVLGTQLCCRVGELKRLKICNFLPGFDATFHPKYHCSAVFRLRKRKQAQLRRGLYPQVLPRSRPELCTVQRLKACCRPEGSGSRQTKGAHPATKCRHCPALFTSERRMVFNSSYSSRSRTRSSSQAYQDRLSPGIGHLHAQGGASRRRCTHRCQSRCCFYRTDTDREWLRVPTWCRRTREFCSRRRGRCASEHCGYQLAVMFRQKTEGGSGRTQIPMSLERKTLC